MEIEGLSQAIETKKAIEKMLEPYKQLQEQLKGTAELISESIKPNIQMSKIADLNLKPLVDASLVTESFREQINSIIKPLQVMESAASVIEIPDFFKSYNATRELINDFENYEHVDKERLEEIKQVKNEVGELPDIESAYNDLSEDEKGLFKSLFHKVYTVLPSREVVKEKTEGVTKLVAGEVVSYELGRVIVGFEQHSIIVDILLEIFI